MQGVFELVCQNSDGSLVWREEFPNGVTNVGVSYTLNTSFAASAQSSAWALGLINNAGFTSLAAADTMSSHSGWTEFTSYSEANRPAWTVAAVSAGTTSIANSTAATFTMSTTGELKGLFLVDQNTKGGSTGTLWSTGAFSAVRSVASGQILTGRYSIPGRSI